MLELNLLFFVSLAGVAALYASVGHGGASGYLAVMALWGISGAELRSTALILNLFVSAVAFSQFARVGAFRKSLFLPFAVASVPLAFLGAKIQLSNEIYRPALGVLLLIAVARLWIPSAKAAARPRIPFHLGTAALIGAAIGLISGAIGIGGGILLSPALLLLGWCSAREAAAVSALFIFVNSAAGLAGLGQRIASPPLLWVPATLAVLAGGSIGASLGAGRFSNRALRTLLGGVVGIAAYKLIWS